MPPRHEQEATAHEARKRRVPWYRQPYKTFYVIYQFGFLFLLQLPVLCIKFILPSLRPSRNWNWLQSIFVIVIRRFVRIGTNAGVLQKKKDVTKVDMPSVRAVRRKCGSHCHAVFLDPLSEDDVVGEVKDLMVENDVHPAGVAIYWYGEDIADTPLEKAGANEKVVVHFHGGGYIVRIFLHLHRVASHFANTHFRNSFLGVL